MPEIAGNLILEIRAMPMTLLINLDGFVRIRKNPSPLMGEGWGEGDAPFALRSRKKCRKRPSVGSREKDANRGLFGSRGMTAV